MNFWSKIKDELEYQGISQKEFAVKLNIKIQSFRNSMSLNRIPDLFTAYKMAQILKQPLEYFISDNEDIFAPNNFHLPTREIKLLENYRKLSEKEKRTIDMCAESLASDRENSDSNIL